MRTEIIKLMRELNTKNVPRPLQGGERKINGSPFSVLFSSTSARPTLTPAHFSRFISSSMAESSDIIPGLVSETLINRPALKPGDKEKIDALLESTPTSAFCIFVPNFSHLPLAWPSHFLFLPTSNF